MATNYDINYDDQRFKEVESDKQIALTENEKLYNGMIESSDKYYQAQIDASKQWADKQTQLQQEKTDFAIEKIEQEKAQAKKDYTKEQSGAYVDWQKQSNNYGVNAEQMASQGLQNSGYSESSQVSMYNTYQNRVYTARETYNQIVMNFNNSIKDAQLQNNSILAEIAFEAQQKQLELNLQGFQYKNTLLLEQANKKLTIESEYYKRYQDVLDQINKENALAEQIRQYNESLALEKEQFEWQKAQAARSYSSGGGGRGSSNYQYYDDTPVINKTNLQAGATPLKKTGSATLTQTIDDIARMNTGTNLKTGNVLKAVSAAQKDGTISSKQATALKRQMVQAVKALAGQ